MEIEEKNHNIIIIKFIPDHQTHMCRVRKSRHVFDAIAKKNELYSPHKRHPHPSLSCVPLRGFFLFLDKKESEQKINSHTRQRVGASRFIGRTCFTDTGLLLSPTRDLSLSEKSSFSGFPRRKLS